MRTLKQTLPILTMALIILALIGCASTDTRSGTGEYIDDTVITGKVKAAILKHPDLRSSEINVETFKGVVQLSGFVTSQDDINDAVEVARAVAGVKSVRNDMQLR